MISLCDWSSDVSSSDLNGRTIHPDECSSRPARPSMNGASDQLLAGSGFSRDQDRRLRRCNLRDLRQHPSQRFGGSDNLLEHRGAIDHFAQCQILVSDSLFGLLAVFDVGPRRIPANDMSLFVTQGPVVDKKPTTPTVFPACPKF